MPTGFAADLRQAENGGVKLLGCVQVGGVDRCLDHGFGGWGGEYGIRHRGLSRAEEFYSEVHVRSVGNEGEPRRGQHGTGYSRPFHTNVNLQVFTTECRPCRFREVGVIPPLNESPQ